MTYVAGTEFLGTWETDALDRESLRKFGRVTLEIKVNGRLIYTIHEQNKEQKIFLKYGTENGTLVTDQPSTPREERTPYSITPDGKLVLTHGNFTITCIRKRV